MPLDLAYVSEEKAEIWNAYDREEISYAELYLRLDELSKAGTGLITQRQMQRELGEVIGPELAPYIVDFYLEYAYKVLKEGGSLEKVKATAIRRKEVERIEQRTIAQNIRWAEMFSNKL